MSKWNIYNYRNDEEALNAACERIDELEAKLQRQDEYYLGERDRMKKAEAENDQWAEKWIAERAENQRLREAATETTEYLAEMERLEGTKYMRHKCLYNLTAALAEGEE